MFRRGAVFKRIEHQRNILMNKIMALAATVAAIAAVAPASAATTVVTQDNTAATANVLVFTDGIAKASFGATYTSNVGFADAFFFTLAQAANITAGELTSNADTLRGNLIKDLDLSFVNLATGAITPLAFQSNGSDKNEKFEFPANQLPFALAAGTYSLNVAGTVQAAPASYAGSLTFGAVASAVPEPATWAMMIGGFGMVGGTMRSARRKQKASVSFA
jgi:hypothetical protein